MKILKGTIRELVGKLPWSWQDYIYYTLIFKRPPRVRRPKTFNEKVLSRKRLGDLKRYAGLADKFLVRDYIAEKIGSKYLVPLLFHTQNPEDLIDGIDWRNLAIKPSHGAGMVKLIGDKILSYQEKLEIIETCKKWLSIDYSEFSRELHYRFIEPRILVERLLGDGIEAPNDYKFHCFPNGAAVDYVLQLVKGRFSESESRGYYLNSLDNCVWHHGGGHHRIPTEDLAALNEAIGLNKVLSEAFDYVRVDWYVCEGRLFFGELTFTPGAGLSNEFGQELELLMGKMWK